MSGFEKGVGVGIIFYIMLICAMIYGYVLNIIAIVNAIDLPISGMFILRCVGVVAAPLGSILGIFF